MSDGGTCFKCGKPLVPTCPECGEPVEVWSRIVGYYRPVSNWNPGKQQEFQDRREYELRNGSHQENEEPMTLKDPDGRGVYWGKDCPPRE